MFPKLQALIPKLYFLSSGVFFAYCDANKVWYTNLRKKRHGRTISRLTVRDSNIFSLDCRFKKCVDHTFDHLQTPTVWKQCEREHALASISDTKAPKSRKNHLKIKCATLRDVEVASSYTPTEDRRREWVSRSEAELPCHLDHVSTADENLRLRFFFLTKTAPTRSGLGRSSIKRDEVRLQTEIILQQ